MFKLFMMFILILFSTSGVKAESSLCDKLLGQPDYLKDERVYLVRLCTMKSLSESAITVYLERGHLPVLEEFFPIIPRENEIFFRSTTSPKLKSIRSFQKWPYLTMRVRSIEVSEDRLRPAQLKREIKSKVLVESGSMCDLPMSLFYYQMKAPDLEFVADFYDLRIGKTSVVFTGNAESLAIVTAETFSRLNCQQ